MNTKLLFIVFLFIFTFTSCVYSEVAMDETEVFVKLNQSEGNCNEYTINLEYGNIEKISNCLYKLTFFKAQGGITKIFGNVINDKSPQGHNQVNININNELIKSSNFNEIKKSEKFINKNHEYYIIDL